MQVREIMTKNPEIVEETDLIRDALGKMLELDVRHIPVVRSGKLVGMLSDRDIRDYSLPASEEYYEPANARAKLDQSVATIMSADVTSVFQNTTLLEMVDLMIDDKYGALPVIEGSDERLVGIVSYIDVLKAVRSYLEE